MIATLALAAALSGPPIRMPGPDKMKHFFVSAFVHSISFSAARAAGMERRDAQVTGAAISMSVGVWKEFRDLRSGTSFSGADLVFDAAGALSAAALLNATR